MDQVVGEWAAAMRASGRSADTIRSYTQAVLGCARYAGKAPLELDAGDVARWLGRPLSKNTRAAYYRRLRAWRVWCRKTRRGKLKLLHGIDPTPGQKTRPKPVSEADLGALLGACRNDQERMMLLLAGWMGLRRSELCAVDGLDYDPAAGTLQLVGKGGKPAVLPVPPVVAEAAARMPVEGPWFTSGRGAALGRQGMACRMSALAARAGCPEVTLHMLRHRFATRLVVDGQHLFLVQELMRHSSASTTKGYVQVDPDQMAAAVARLPRAA